jgi:hypothetical protein
LVFCFSSAIWVEVSKCKDVSAVLRAAAELEPELTDEEVAEQELDGEDVAVIPSESWRVVEPRATELLSATELHGLAGGRRWLDELGVEWWRPTRLTDQRRRDERRVS